MQAQLSLFNDISKKLFNSAQKINELNIQVAQTIMEESVKSSHELLAAEDATDFISIAASQAQPGAEKVRAYQQHLTNIAAGTQVELAKAAEEHIPETTRTAAALAEEVARKANEETEKVTQRQKAAMEKLTNPINAREDSNGHGSSSMQSGSSSGQSGSGSSSSQSTSSSQGARKST